MTQTEGAREVNPQSKASLAIQAYFEELPTRERAIEAIANDMHDAHEEGHTALAELMFNEAVEELKLFDKEERARNPDPRRAAAKVAMMYSIVYDAAARYREAIEYDRASLELAVTPEERAKACHNVGCGYNQLEEHALALQYHERALRLEPGAGWTIAGWFKTKVALGETESAFDELLNPSLTRAMAPEAWEVFDAHRLKDSGMRAVRDDRRWEAIRRNAGR